MDNDLQKQSVRRILFLALGMLWLSPTMDAQQSSGTSLEGHFVYGTWLPYWGMKEGKKSLERDQILNALSPVWYEVRADGSLDVKIKASAGYLKESARQKGLALTPSLAIFDYQDLAEVIGDPNNRKRHIDAILNEVRTHDFDGIDIDYEAIGIANQEDYFLFLESLSNGLHKRGKTLSVTVLSKWGDDVEYTVLPQTHEVQDCARIGKLADEVRIMAYDYTFPKSTYPGPIAPNHWVEDVLEYAITKIPREKIILGIHLYGYEWRSTNEQDLKLMRNPAENPLGTKQAKSFTHELIQDIMNKNQGKLEQTEGEDIFRYSVSGNGTPTEHRVLIFPGSKGVAQKVALAHKHNLGGVFFWRLGGNEDLHFLKDPVAVRRKTH